MGDDDAEFEFWDRLGNEFYSEEFSDVTITCDTKTWKLHRVILCQHSPWFRAALSGAYFKEAQSQQISLHDEDPRILEPVLKWMYSNQPVPDTLEGFPNPYVLLLEQFRVADFFQMPYLQNVIKGMIVNGFKSDFKGKADVYPDLTNGVESSAVSQFVEGLKHACDIFGADKESKLFTCLIECCLRIFPLLMISTSYGDLISSDNGHVFLGSRVMANYCFGIVHKQSKYIPLQWIVW
ncbi:POZ domain-containing protein [Microthyrium microscopicum]|uniref:POZ domain-containing protein n=1 Tax=Microthyrium microscopicum TaxID=703497 RepID=A0A6A6U4N5_9PEZI|nr:POZ domain-containing protein [Microthyrium microscopicum]